MKKKNVVKDTSGFVQYLLLIIALIPLLIILWGISDVNSNHLGMGLIKIGVGLVLYGAGGSLVIRHPALMIAGAGAFVIMIVGIIILVVTGA
jgi:hypothetical protein